MAYSLEPTIPLDLDPDVLADLVEKAKDYALMHGKLFFFYAIGELKCAYHNIIYGVPQKLPQIFTVIAYICTR